MFKSVKIKNKDVKKITLGGGVLFEKASAFKNVIGKLSLGTTNYDANFWYSYYNDNKYNSMERKKDGYTSFTTFAKPPAVSYSATYTKLDKQIKENTDYTLFVQVKNLTGDNTSKIINATNFTEDVFAEDVKLNVNYFFEGETKKIKLTTISDFSQSVVLTRTYIQTDNNSGIGSFDWRMWIVEGDHTETGDNLDIPFSYRDENLTNISLLSPSVWTDVEYSIENNNTFKFRTEGTTSSWKTFNIENLNLIENSYYRLFCGFYGTNPKMLIGLRSASSNWDWSCEYSNYGTPTKDVFKYSIAEIPSLVVAGVNTGVAYDTEVEIHIVEITEQEYIESQLLSLGVTPSGNYETDKAQLIELGIEV